MNYTHVSRWIRGFHPTRDTLDFEHRLPDDWTATRLQVLLGRPSDDPMYGDYPIDEAQAARLGTALGIDLLALNLNLFVEADAER